MKKFCRLIVSGCLLFLIISMFSCSEEIDLYPDGYEGQLFVWACLDGTGEVQQVKIRKAILGEASLNELLKDPSSYLPDDSLEVYLVPESGMPVYLQPVIHPPQTGAFAEDSNVVYETPHYYPWPGEKHKLVITNLETGLVTSSEISAILPPEFTYPSPKSIRSKFNFTDRERPFYITWNDSGNSIWSISLKYLDILKNGDTLYRKKTFSSEPGESTNYREFALPYLYNIFNKLIPEDPAVDFRMFYRFDFGVWSSDARLSSYIFYSRRFSDNRKQKFDNIDNGTGLFYSVNHAYLKEICPKESFAIVLHQSDSVKHLKFSQFLYPGFFIDPDSVASNPVNACGQ